MLKELHLCGKKIDIENSPVVLSYQPDENWEKVFRRLRGKWSVENGWLIGEETGNFGGILLTHEFFEKDVMISFTMASVLPATRDLNALFCARVDEENHYLGDSYVCGLNGWWEYKSVQPLWKIVWCYLKTNKQTNKQTGQNYSIFQQFHFSVFT